MHITTTPSFENGTITEYKAPVVTHIAMGLNFMKDVFTSFTDVFGGKSKSYQSTLDRATQEAINELVTKAHYTGANAIVGLKIDTGEISSKDKSLIMITVSGTPVEVAFKNSTAPTNQGSPKNQNTYPPKPRRSSSSRPNCPRCGVPINNPYSGCPNCGNGYK